MMLASWLVSGRRWFASAGLREEAGFEGVQLRTPGVPVGRHPMLTQPDTGNYMQQHAKIGNHPKSNKEFWHGRLGSRIALLKSRQLSNKIWISCTSTHDALASWTARVLHACHVQRPICFTPCMRTGHQPEGGIDRVKSLLHAPHVLVSNCQAEVGTAHGGSESHGDLGEPHR